MQISELLLKQTKYKQNSIMFKGLFLFLFADSANNYQFGFQDPATFLMEGIIDLHHDIMFFFNMSSYFSKFFNDGIYFW